MSFALQELTGLLVPEQAIVGVVVSIDGDRVVVATARGAVAARPSGAVLIADRVVIRSGFAERAPVAEVVYPV